LRSQDRIRTCKFPIATIPYPILESNQL